MAYVRKPEEEVEGGGQVTRFGTSGPGMVGGIAEGGQGLAGGPSPKTSSTFINPDAYLKQNVGAGKELASKIGQTFGQPSQQIQEQIGKEGQQFEQQARAGQVKFGDDLSQRAATSPMGLTQDDIGTLGERLQTQYQGPMAFQESAQVTDPLAALQDRIAAYVPGTDPTGRAQGILTEGARQQLVGEVMKPTSVGGKRALEELLLTTQQGALGTLGSQIAQAGSAVERLQQERKEAADLVKSQQEQAAKTRQQAEQAIQTGIGSLEGMVDERVRAEREAAGERQEQFKDLFDMEYTDQEKALAERLGLRGEREDDQGEMVEFDQAQEIQNLLASLADPYGDQGFLREEDQFRGDEITGLTDDQMVDPLSYFTNLDPENLYTRESMIEQSEADRMQALQDLLGGGTANIQRAEDALGSGALSITGTPEDLIERLTGQKDVMMGEAERIRDKRIADEAAAQVSAQFPDIGSSSPGAPTPFNPSITELSGMISNLENEISGLQAQMDLHNSYEEGLNYIQNSGMSQSEAQQAIQEHIQEYSDMGYQEPGIFGTTFTQGSLDAALSKLGEYQQHQSDMLAAAAPPPVTTGGGGGFSGPAYNRPGIDYSDNAPGQGWGGGDTGYGSSQSQDSGWGGSNDDGWSNYR